MIYQNAKLYNVEELAEESNVLKLIFLKLLGYYFLKDWLIPLG